MNNKRWLGLLTIIPLICLLVVTNIYVDPANIFHDDSADIAQAILDGKGAYFPTGNVDERAVKQRLIESMPKDLECLTIGPSLTMGIRQENVGTESYYNLSASSLHFYDYLAIFGLLEANQIEADKIILCVDSYFFDLRIYYKGSRRSEFMPYADYMISLLENQVPVTPDNNTQKQLWQKIQQAFSVTYFQAAVNVVQKNNSFKSQVNRWGIVDETTNHFTHYMADGSYVYDLDYRSRTEEDVLADCASYDAKYMFANGACLNEDGKKIFIKLIEHLLDKGIEVEFFLCPLAPALWDKIENDPNADQYHILAELEAFAAEIAEEKNIKIIGSYNPYNIGIGNEDFLDARHIRHEKLQQYFDFK